MTDRTDFKARDGSDLRFRDREPRIHPSASLKECRLGRATEVAERVFMRDTVLGDYSYVERHSELRFAEVGKFCSIASNVVVNALNHPLDRVTTHKISYRPNEYFRFASLDKDLRESRQAARVTIGNDVWIGTGAIILPGITIADGAVVGASAVVTRDVEPYAIVSGMPARRRRFRFDTQTAGRLLALGWWNWPEEVLFEAVADMRACDVTGFLAKWEKLRPETGG